MQSVETSSSLNEETEVGTGVVRFSSVTRANVDLNSIKVEYSKKNINSEYDESAATVVTLDDSRIDISGFGAQAEGNKITINSKGSYIVSGTLMDGQLIVDASKEDTVQIILDNANIINESGSAFYVKQAEKVIITLADDSINSVSDGVSYIDIYEEAPDAAIYSGDDLTINGSGTLLVNGNYKHGIKTVDDLVVTGGEIVVTAVEDGLRGKNSVSVLDVNLTIDAGGDGVKSNNNEDEASGWISIDGGTFDIRAGESGIQAETGLLISRGDLRIVAVEDALHSNGSIGIAGGNLEIDAGDDGAHADEALIITGGMINVIRSYEGLEGSQISILGGSIFIMAEDDGINAAGGSDEDTHSMDIFNETGEYFVSISGGYLYVNSEGDGIDSNGDIYISGGTAVVDGPSLQNNGAMDIDSGGNFEVMGGALIAIGSSSMLVTPTVATQPVFTILYDSEQNPDEIITIKDSDGDELFSIDPTKSYQSIMITSPELRVNDDYSLAYGGEYLGQSVDGTLYLNSELAGETNHASLTLTDWIMFITPDGTVTEYSAGVGWFEEMKLESSKHPEGDARSTNRE
jgi:hypothetical protein